MFKLDDNLLKELGLGTLPVDDKNKMLAHIYETLEMRVGMKLAEQMSDEQLDEFEGFIDRNDEAGALSWLETNFPNYKQVVAEELERLKAEIRTQAPQIVAATMAQYQQVPVQDHTQYQQPQMPQQAPIPQQAPPVEYAAPQYQPPPMPPQDPAQYQQPQTPYQAQPTVDPYAQQPQPPSDQPV